MRIWEYCIERIKAKGIGFLAGLSPTQLATIEERLNFQFPPDLADFLRAGLPYGPRFPDWLSVAEGGLQHPTQGYLERPLEGLRFDVKHNQFWMKNWGERPDDLQACYAIVEKKFREAPVLIPIFAHRYMPASPNKRGNPVFSVWQTDIIYYGMELPDYLSAEFSFPLPPKWRVPSEPRKIEFWNEIVS